MQNIQYTYSSIIPFFNVLTILCFIYSLKYLSSQETARNGSRFGVVGMMLGILVPVCIALMLEIVCSKIYQNSIAYFLDANRFQQFLIPKSAVVMVIIAVASIIGFMITRKVKMSDLPQLLAAFHSLVGLGAVFIALAMLFTETTNSLIKQCELLVGASIGAYTFIASIVAFLKLKNSSYAVEKCVNVLLSVHICKILLAIVITSISAYVSCIIDLSILFYVVVLSSCLYGAIMVAKIGGADMPIVISFLNALSGWATSGIGFTVDSNILIVVGAIVGASGTFLSQTMCSNMNRKLWDVLFHNSAQRKSNGKLQSNMDATMSDDMSQINVNTINTAESVTMIKSARTVIIVPGYGMATAHAQHDIKEIVQKLSVSGIDVKFAIHPIAGRMPGHMNVILAEANIPYDIVYDLDEINDEFRNTDIALVIGANDITNTSARTDESSPIYGMPILNVDQAKNVLFIKRSLKVGYANIDNPLFYQSNVHMLFGDAKKVCHEIASLL